jgi:hypothetical protein
MGKISPLQNLIGIVLAEVLETMLSRALVVMTRVKTTLETSVEDENKENCTKVFTLKINLLFPSLIFSILFFSSPPPLLFHGGSARIGP